MQSFISAEPKSPASGKGIDLKACQHDCRELRYYVLPGQLAQQGVTVQHWCIPMLYIELECMASH